MTNQKAAENPKTGDTVIPIAFGLFLIGGIAILLSNKKVKGLWLK